MSPVPLSLVLFFLVTVAVGLVLFARAASGSRWAIGLALAWIAAQSALALRGFFLNTQAVPPHLALALAPPVLLIALLFIVPSGKRFLDRMDLKWLVLLHSVRILVEISLFWLYRCHQVPRLLTFEGGNVDILFGLSAPLIWWAYQRKSIGQRGLLIWNTVALLGVLNAVVRALLSAPFRFQQFGFSQPTIAILRFPFVLLPAFLVPAVLLCHFALFRRLTGARSRLA